MRLAKTTGLVAIATVAFVATIGLGSATAETPLEKVVWCAKRIPHTCAAANYFPTGTEIFAAATDTEFLSNLGNITCAASELHMTNTNSLVHGNVTVLVFAECAHEKKARHVQLNQKILNTYSKVN